MIYFVRPKSGGYIKIGTTIRLSERLKQLAAECGEELEVLAVVDGTYPEENALHRRFAHLRQHGEWFEPGDDLMGFIVSDAWPWDGKDTDDRKGKKPPARYELRVDPDWLARVQRQAERLGIAAADYIRQATTLRLEQDEATEPDE